jgi:hypothetical protein
MMATVTATGTVNPVISVQVGSQVTGKIFKLFADYNSSVKEGQPVAQIDPAPFEAKVVEARAVLHNARGSLRKAEVDLDQHRIELARMINLRFGDLLGVAAGIAGALVVTLVAGWPTIIAPQAVIIAFFFSVAVGVFFGLYPANKASRLKPIDALRYE